MSEFFSHCLFSWGILVTLFLTLVARLALEGRCLCDSWEDAQYLMP